MSWNRFDDFLAEYRASNVINSIPSDATVLDLGCGDGRLLFEIKDKIDRGIGIDKKIKNYDDGKIKLLNADLERRLPFDDNFFDIVISLAVLEHLEDPLNAAGEIYRVLKKGGMLFLSVPTPKAKPLLEFLAFQLGVISKTDIADHKRYWSKKEIIYLLEKSNFKEIEHKYFQLRFNQFVVAIK